MSLSTGEVTARAGRDRATRTSATAQPAGRPARFTPAFVVQAHAIVDVDDALGWVRQVSLDPYVRTEVSTGSVMVVSERAGDSQRQTAIQPGEVLVQQPGSRFGWDVYDASSFNAAYTRRPRELPVFDDGEVA